MPRSTLPPEARDEVKNMVYRRQVSEFKSADPKESGKENVGRTEENRGNRGGRIVKKIGEK
jgi:hypothetical protein